MGEFAKALSKFIGRDIPLILGGGSVLIASLYLFNKINLLCEISTPYVLFIAGISYAIGYAIQEGFSLIRLVNTSTRVEPCSCLQWLFRNWSGRKWNDADSSDAWEKYFKIYNNKYQYVLAPLERIITLQQIGTALGSNWLVTSILLCIKACKMPERYNWFLCLSVFFLSILLIVSGWLQAMEKVSVLHKFINNHDKSK